MSDTDFRLSKLYDKIQNQLNCKNVEVPDDINIYTITMETNLKETFYPINIFKYIKRCKNGITRAINEKENKKESKNKKDTNRFLNQVTLYVNVSGKEKDVSVKVFKNGKLHCTGCLSIDDMLEAINKIFIECKKDRAIYNYETKKMEKIKFVDNPDNLCLENLENFEIDLINCGFKVPFRINLSKLKNLLTLDNYKVQYDTLISPGLFVYYTIPKEYYDKYYTNNKDNTLKTKYENMDNKITVYNTGIIAIIIGKNRGLHPIKPSYEFIYKYLLDNYDKIVSENNTTVSSIEEFLLDNYKDESSSESDESDDDKIKGGTIICNRNTNDKKEKKVVVSKEIVHNFFRL